MLQLGRVPLIVHRAQARPGGHCSSESHRIGGEEEGAPAPPSRVGVEWRSEPSSLQPIDAGKRRAIQASETTELGDRGRLLTMTDFDPSTMKDL